MVALAVQTPVTSFTSYGRCGRYWGLGSNGTSMLSFA